MRQKMVFGNWKMHGSFEQIQHLLQDVILGLAGEESTVVGICPPYPYLQLVKKLCSNTNMKVGAQNVSQHDSGAFTGEVAASMLSDLGVNYAIVGHSERRELYGETSDLVAKKFMASQCAAITPILCVGETLVQRDNGETEAVVLAQLQAVIAAAGVEAFSNAVLAYEPVWAIGTGKTATPEQAQEVHRLLRKHVAALSEDIAANLQILYGGSVKDSNAGALFTQADIDGGLVGGASLHAEQFIAICAYTES
jgi:triosephosphate isomerase